MTKKKLFKWLTLLTWLVIIFLFSSQPHSGDTTGNIIEQLIQIPKTKELIDTINFLVRKSAHLTEYFILALLTISLLKEYTKEEKQILIMSVLFCFFYACTDEFHQSFVPGRTSTLKDILIDTTGGIIATIIYYLYQKKYHNKNIIDSSKSQ